MKLMQAKKQSNAGTAEFADGKKKPLPTGIGKRR